MNDENERKLLWICIKLLLDCVKQTYEHASQCHEYSDPHKESFEEQVMLIESTLEMAVPELKELRENIEKEIKRRRN